MGPYQAPMVSTFEAILWPRYVPTNSEASGVDMWRGCPVIEEITLRNACLHGTTSCA